MPLVRRVLLLGEDLDGVLELGSILVDGLLILLGFPLGLGKLMFSDQKSVGKGAPLVEG